MTIGTATICIIALLGVQSGAALQLVMNPRQGTQSLVERVRIGCRTDDMDIGTTKIIIIQITKGDYESMAMVLHNGQVSFGTNKTGRIEAVGNVDNMEIMGGFLNVTLPFPTYTDTGLYKCHLVTLNSVGVLKNTIKSVFLDIDRPDYSRTSSRIQSVENELPALAERLAALEAANSKSSTDGNPAFSAAVGRQKYYVSKSMDVVFDDVISRQGSGYNPSTGIFTAPVDGIYAFFLVLQMEVKGAAAGFSMRVGARELARLYVEDADMGDQSSVSSVVDLKAGQSVRVMVSYKSDTTGYLYHNRYSVFSGFLIRPL